MRFGNDLRRTRGIAWEVGPGADVEACRFEGLDPPVGILQFLVRTGQKQTLIVLVPDPGVFHKPDPLCLQPVSEPFPDAFPLIEIKASVGSPFDQYMVHAEQPSAPRNPKRPCSIKRWHPSVMGGFGDSLPQER